MVGVPGDMAGMAMGMLALGVLLGTVSMLVILRKLGLSSDMEYIPMNSRRQWPAPVNDEMFLETQYIPC